MTWKVHFKRFWPRNKLRNMINEDLDLSARSYQANFKRFWVSSGFEVGRNKEFLNLVDIKILSNIILSKKHQDWMT